MFPRSDVQARTNDTSALIGGQPRAPVPLMKACTTSSLLLRAGLCMLLVALGRGRFPDAQLPVLISMLYVEYDVTYMVVLYVC